MAKSGKKTVAEIITGRILEALDKGRIPWIKPWDATPARNHRTGRKYNGINKLLLDSGEYLTFKQVTELGGRVKAGEKGWPVVFFSWIEKEDEETGEAKKAPMMKYYTVFEVSQCEGIARKYTETRGIPTEADAEAIVEGYEDKPEIKEWGGKAFYDPNADAVVMPFRNTFKTTAGWYGTLFHELIHSTGAAGRLDRHKKVRVGSEGYAKEELIAEIGAAMLSSEAGLEVEIENHAAYIDCWRRAISEDPRLIVSAAQNAQKAADYILGEKVKK